MRTGFPPGVADKIGWYVYRLIDPRNGETFYVGKGKGDRVFDHARCLLSNDAENVSDLKTTRIREIHARGFEVAHVIHQHGIPDEQTAYRVETAVLDCFQGLANAVSGRGAGEYGVRHVEEIISAYELREFMPGESLIAISIGDTYAERSIYEAVRGVWKIDVNRARKSRLVLAIVKGVVRGAFRPAEWVGATTANFPYLESDVPGRFGFIGTEAEAEIRLQYMGMQMPARYRHSQNPIRFIEPEL